jgi:glutamine phosphoribosylpyrophosphate amidotransferase
MRKERTEIFTVDELEREIISYKKYGLVSEEFNKKAIKETGISGIGIIQHLLGDYGW